MLCAYGSYRSDARLEHSVGRFLAAVADPLAPGDKVLTGSGSALLRIVKFDGSWSLVVLVVWKETSFDVPLFCSSTAS